MIVRTEHDSMGEVQVPQDALYGAQTQRALDNFGLHDRPMPQRFIRNLAQIKGAAATANNACQVLSAPRAGAIEAAAAAVAAGNHLEAFPVSVFQTGSGTSTNMNMNEVLAHLASADLGEAVHPNDHVNCSQSSNDVIPSALQLSALQALEQELLPALQTLAASVAERAVQLGGETKTGRTHLMDAMPLTMGQELSGWHWQLLECIDRFDNLLPRLRQIPIGGSAVGTGVNVPPGFAAALCEELAQRTGLTPTPCSNPFSRMAGQDVALECAACQRALAVVLTKICNDLRWMASGPLAGLGDITLEALQPGSSIMPGKVNPVLPEAVLMVCADVVGSDATVSLAAASGNFQLNVMLPLIADKLDTSTTNLTWACQATARTVRGFTVNRERLQSSLAANPILVTALNARIGYAAAAAIAYRSYAEGRPVLDVAEEETDIARDELARLLDPVRLTAATESDS